MTKAFIFDLDIIFAFLFKSTGAKKDSPVWSYISWKGQFENINVNSIFWFIFEIFQRKTMNILKFGVVCILKGMQKSGRPQTPPNNNNNNNNNALLALTTKRHIYMASDKLQ